MRIIHGSSVSEVELNSTKTASLIKKALPLKAGAQVWKEEIYFEIPVDTPQENGTPRVSPGDVAYWPPGKCLCIFFGKTQPVSAVTVVGKVAKNLEMFRQMKDGDTLSLENGP